MDKGGAAPIPAWRRVAWVTLCAAVCASSARGDGGPETRDYDVHFQATVATQAHPGFSAAYSGLHSLRSDAESATSVVMDLFTAARLWPGAELYFSAVVPQLQQLA